MIILCWVFIVFDCAAIGYFSATGNGGMVAFMMVCLAVTVYGTMYRMASRR